MLGNSVLRALTLAAAVTCAATAGAPANALSESCSYDTSVRLVTAQDRRVRVWVDESGGRTYVCFAVSADAVTVGLGEAGLDDLTTPGVDLVAGSIDLGDPAGPGAPAVTPGTGCANDLVDVEDPVSVAVGTDVLGGGLDVCVAFGTVPFSLTVTLPAADAGRVVLELDPDSALGESVCAQSEVCTAGVARFVIL